MAKIAFQARARANLERIELFIAAEHPAAASETLELIFDAIAILERHPLIGRPAEEGLRELVISQGRSGYVALYEYLEADDLVAILAIRHQRESGYPQSR